PPAVQPVGAQAALRSRAQETDPPPPLDVPSGPDLLSELEQEIFHDDPWASHPPGLSGAAVEVEGERPEEAPAGSEPEPVAAAPSDPGRNEPAVEAPPDNLRQVSFDSGPRTEAASTPAEPWPVPPPPWVETPADPPPPAGVAARDAGPAEEDEPVVATVGPPTRSDTAMRLAVGLGAAG